MWLIQSRSQQFQLNRSNGVALYWTQTAIQTNGFTSLFWELQFLRRRWSWKNLMSLVNIYSPCFFHFHGNSAVTRNQYFCIIPFLYAHMFTNFFYSTSKNDPKYAIFWSTTRNRWQKYVKSKVVKRTLVYLCFSDY